MERSARASCGRHRPGITSLGCPNKRASSRHIVPRRACARLLRQGQGRGECAFAASAAGRFHRKWRRRCDAHGAARRSAWNPQQAQRYRPDDRAPPRPIGAVERRNRSLESLRGDGAVGRGEVDRGLRPSRRAARRQALGPGVLGLALQGIAVAQRRRAPGLRCLAQELRNDISGRPGSARGTGKLEQPVEREEVRRRGRRAAKRFDRCASWATTNRASAAEGR